MGGAVDIGGGMYELVGEWNDENTCKKSLMVDACTECVNSAVGTSATVITSVITYWPQLLTDLQRSTRFGDVNCQSAMGATTAILPGTLTSLAALSAFAAICKSAMPVEFHGTSIHWNLGPGFICLLIATLLKVVDFFYHMALPTPPARWQKPTGEAATDIVEYMKSATAMPGRWGGC